MLVFGLAIIFLAILMVLFTDNAEATDHVVISEWTSRGPGGSTDEFVELYNPTDSDVDISGWEIWTYNASALFCPEWGIRVTLPGAQGSMTTVIPTKHHFLIADSCGSWTGPTPDAWFVCTFGFKDDNGTIRLTTGAAGTNATVDTVSWEAYPDPLGARLWAEGGIPTVGRSYNDDWKSVERKAFAGSNDASMAQGGADYYWGNGEDTENTVADWFVKTTREPQGLRDWREPPILNLDTGVYYVHLQTAVDAANSGERLNICGGTFQGGMLLDGKSLTIVNSAFGLHGTVSLKNGASLTVDPSWWNVTGDIYVDNGTTLTLDNTILQINGALHGQFRIQVNDTGTLEVIGDSTIQSSSSRYYNHIVYGSLIVKDSTLRWHTSLQIIDGNFDSIMENAVVNTWQINGLSLSNTDMMISNSSFSGIGIADFNLDADSHLTVINTTFGKNDIVVNDALSDLTVQWYLHAYAYDTGGPIDGATISVSDSIPTDFQLGYTDSSGWYRWGVVTEFVQYMSLRETHTPHNIYAVNPGIYGSTPVLMDASKTVTINVSLLWVHNVEQVTDYPGIQIAVNNANPGEHLEVYNPFQNETVFVDRAITISGVGSPAPIVSGAGIASTFRIAAEGVEITGFNITNTAAHYGILASIGGFNIHHNVFSAQGYGIMVRIYHLSS